MGSKNMIYKVGMLCKHFKGKDLLEKNIYRIEQIGVDGKDIDDSLITYTGEGNLRSATNLIVYSNIFQDNKMFCREYEDISQELSNNKQQEFCQKIKVQPLTEEEQIYIGYESFIETKKQLILKKFSK
jgi:hypothetical protein